MTILVRAFVIFSLAAVMNGCATNNKTGFVPATRESLAALAEVELKLTRLVVDDQEVALLAGRPVTARLQEGGRIAGQGPVNRFTGAYELGRAGVIIWPAGGLAGTRMAGAPEAMDLEEKFFGALVSASILETSTHGVTFRNGDGTTRVEFARPSS